MNRMGCLPVRYAVALLAVSTAAAQVCRLSVAGLNRNRKVFGNVNAECPSPLHSSPFGNWGVTSNFGGKINGHQFQGWCQNRRVCDNKGSCFNVCGDRWYEWNSCTDHPDTKPPNCTLYNAKDCTEQESPLGINVMSTRTVDVPVRCPLDTDGDGQFDRGGCADLVTWTPGQNFMSLYELDPFATDELVQTLYFPPTPVPAICNVLGCSASGSDWVPPNGYADPAQPARVYAEMAAVVNSGGFVDVGRACPAVPPPFVTLSSASFNTPAAAPESLATAFGFALAAETAVAPAGQPLPLELAGVQVQVTDHAGQNWFAPLLYVSPGQINYQVPAGVAKGLGTVRVLSKGEVVATGAVAIDPVAPGIFTANANGAGAPAALLLRVSSDGTRRFELLYSCGTQAGSCVALPIVWEQPDDQLYLSLYVTGVRGRSSLSAVSVRVGTETFPLLYAGPQGQYPGLDQINVLVPPALAGTAVADLTVTVDGQVSNAVQLRFR